MESYQLLEQCFGEWARAENLVACSSGSSALHLALEAFQFPPGSEVLVPEFTMVACARAVTMAGLKPVFVDCNNSLLMDPELCIQQITPNTRAIMPVHIYGRVCDMKFLSRIARDYDLRIIEDCAESHGAFHNVQVDASCWSFYRNKIVAGEEGGMIAFRDPAQAELARILRCQGFTEAHDFLHVSRGINARMSNANAKPVLESLSHIRRNLRRRAEIANWYDQSIPPEWHMPGRDVCWAYDLRIPNLDLRCVVSALNRSNVAARHAFRPMSEQAEYRGLYLHLNAHRLSREVIYLPVDPEMTESCVAQSVALLLQAIVTSSS